MTRWALVAVLSGTGCGVVHRYPDGTGIEGQLEREIVALKLRIQELEDAADGQPFSRGVSPLVAELHQIFADTPVLITPLPNGAQVSVPTEVVFADPVGLRIREESAMVFDMLATAIVKHDSVEVKVVGHTSDRPVPAPRRGRPALTAMQLTVLQAEAFAEHLSATHDVPLERFWIGGRGPYSPVTSNDLPEGQDANERIELQLVETRE